jgi:hypothetical protein
VKDEQCGHDRGCIGKRQGDAETTESEQRRASRCRAPAVAIRTEHLFTAGALGSFQSGCYSDLVARIRARRGNRTVLLGCRPPWVAARTDEPIILRWHSRPYLRQTT